MIETIDRRLSVITGLLVLISVLLVARLVSFQLQLPPEVRDYFERMKNSSYYSAHYEPPERGEIYDRNGQLLATNSVAYKVSIDVPLVRDPEHVLVTIAALTGRDPVALWEQWLAATEGDNKRLWYPLAGTVTEEVGRRIQAQGLLGVQLEPIATRYYPQGAVGGPLLGFVNAEGQGYYGVEGYYQSKLAGRVEDSTSLASNIPFDARFQPPPRPGADLVLTIDRDVQFLAEQTLAQGVETYQADGGIIIVMDPHDGAILAMASTPGYDPNRYEDYTAKERINPAVSSMYEPGSVFKILTMACALESGVVTPNSVYNDEGIIEVGGREIYNWDRRAYGQQTMTQLLVRSLNVGAAMLSTTLGPSRFYACLEGFGIGTPTGIDLQGEATGLLKEPGDSDWAESDLGTNSFGQGVGVTPLQMITAASAIANHGLLVRPHVIYQQIDGSDVFTAQPQYLGRPISESTARTVTDMMIDVIQYGAEKALVPGYTVAGKTGTAEIPSPAGYIDEETITSLIAFLPAADPQVIVLVRLDRPRTSRWGTQTAAPLFSQFAQRLVVLLEIPPDNVRQSIAASIGG
ncbi:MAG: penicillin-binding protein 2 [Anaerolineae bacterium]